MLGDLRQLFDGLRGRAATIRRGEMTSEAMLASPGPEGLMVRLALALLAEAAVIVAVVTDATLVVETVNVPVVCPAPIVIEFGTPAEPLLLDRFTSTPFAGAALLSVTVPVEF